MIATEEVEEEDGEAFCSVVKTEKTQHNQETTPLYKKNGQTQEMTRDVIKQLKSMKKQKHC